MALTEIQLKVHRFHGSLIQKGSRPLTLAHISAMLKYGELCQCHDYDIRCELGRCMSWQHAWV